MRISANVVDIENQNKKNKDFLDGQNHRGSFLEDRGGSFWGFPMVFFLPKEKM